MKTILCLKNQLGSNDDSNAKEDLNCVKMQTEVVPKPDEFSVYGEQIANKLRNNGRSHQEISITEHHVEQICFNLTMGA
jgi:hypothetical protein